MVYLDLLLLINFSFNMILVGVVSLLSPVPIRRARVVYAALAGTLVYLIFFWFNQYIFIEWACRLLGALAMAAIITNQFEIRVILTRGMLVLVAGQLLGGGIISLILWSRGVGLGSNSVEGLPFPILFLLAMTMAVIVFFSLTSFKRNTSTRRFIGTVTLTVGEVTKTFSCLLDSGNRLLNPINGWPVIILSLKAAHQVFPLGILGWFGNFEGLPPPQWQHRVTLVPYHGVGSAGLLPAVKPDRAVVTDGQNSMVLNRVYIAVRGDFQAMPDYQAIAFPVQNREEGERNDKLTD